MSRLFLRSPLALTAIAVTLAGATGAGAATLHRLAVVQSTGSEGATAFTQHTANSSALQGEVAANANTSIQIPFGVLGEYDATGSTFGVGVAGISTTGYAVGAEAFGGAPSLISIAQGTGNGIEAYTNETSGAHYALYAEDQSGGEAVYGLGENGNGIWGTTASNGGIGVLGTDNAQQSAGFGVYAVDYTTAGQGVHGGSYTGTGIVAHSLSGSSNYPSLETYSEASGTDLLQAVASNTSGQYFTTMRVTYPSANASGAVLTNGGASSDLQIDGDVYVTGNVYGNCFAPSPSESKANCSNSLFDEARSSRGTDYHTYAARQASPTMEDAGEAQLVRGYAHVALDPAFASVINTSSPYLVFTTPNGESKGLYITNKTPAGFDVRENGGGTSSMAFDFRIVAKPFGEAPHRLEAVTASRKTSVPVSAKMAASIANDRHLEAAHRAFQRMARSAPFAKR